MRKACYVFFAFLLASLAVKASAQIECSDPVNTAAGQVRGGDAETAGACVWRGVPFAAPPVKDLRWKPPQPAPAWSGVREAKEFSAMCMQQVPGSLVKLEDKAGMSEDCLYLNVWRPNKTGNPNGPGLPDWPGFSAGSQLIEVFDSELQTETAGLVDRCAFWANHPMMEMPNLK